MLLDIIQDENKLHVSYWGEDGKLTLKLLMFLKKNNLCG